MTKMMDAPQWNPFTSAMAPGTATEALAAARGLVAISSKVHCMPDSPFRRHVLRGSHAVDHLSLDSVPVHTGMYFGGGNATQVNPMNKPLTSEFVSLHLKGRTDGFALKGGDATRGNFTTMWDGVRPDHKIAKTCVHSDETYQPMRKEGELRSCTNRRQTSGNCRSWKLIQQRKQWIVNNRNESCTAGLCIAEFDK